MPIAIYVRQRDGLAEVQHVLEEALDEVDVVLAERESMAVEVPDDLLVQVLAIPVVPATRDALGLSARDDAIAFVGVLAVGSGWRGDHPESVKYVERPLWRFRAGDHDRGPAESASCLNEDARQALNLDPSDTIMKLF
jgi:hypothetical protein